MRDNSPDKTSALINEIVVDARQHAADRVQDAYELLASFCESPIERLFAAQLVHPQLADEMMTRIDWLRPPSGLIAHTEPPPVPGIYVYPQITIGVYRVDFLLRHVGWGSPEHLIVELDGHDFHEKTRQQAQRDKARDRSLVSQGYRLARFTGSEVFRDPFAVAAEALGILLRTR